MKYTISGFSQKKLIEHGLDANDSLILRWFIDFKDTGKMKSFIENKDKYYWVLYDYVIDDMPILNIKKDMLYRRLKKLVKAGILKNKTRRIGGTYSLYAIGDKYSELITDLSENIPTLNGKYSDESRNKLPNKDPSIKDPSIKDPLMIEIENIYKAYPGKCPIKGSSTGKSLHDKKTIKIRLKNGYHDLLETVNRYIKECIESKTWIMNHKTFLNNIPDYSDSDQESDDTNYGMCSEEIEFHKTRKLKNAAS